MDELNRPARSIVKIHLVGPTQAASPSGYALLPRSRRARAVLAVVGLSRDHQCSRSHLASLLWDDASEDAARASLRQALHELAKSFDDFAPGFLRADRETVSLDRQCCWIDVHAFGSGHCDPKLELAEIADFNPQRLLDDLNGLSPSFDDWLLAERTAFGARLAAEMNRQLSAALRPEVSVRQRQIAVGQILKFDPTHERASRAMMRVYVEVGETALALKEFERCRAALRTALDVEPSSETRALYQTIRAASKVSAESIGSPEYPPLPDKPSIVVLPFQNMSGDPEHDYFADGVVHQIIAALSRFKSLFVIARNSSFAYKGTVIDVKQVGRELGVRYVLEGSVRKEGGRVRITGQLIEAASGIHLWADKFEGSLEDIFGLQDRVTTSVVGAIRTGIRWAEYDRLKRQPTTSSSAYDCYLRGHEAFYLETAEGTATANDFFQRAIQFDPNFAKAYSMLAWVYARQLTNEWTPPDEKRLRQAEAYARRGLELAPNDDDVLSSAAAFFSLAMHNQTMADNLLEQVAALNPNNWGVWTHRGWINVFLGEHRKAIEQFEFANRLSPLDPVRYSTDNGLGAAHFFLRDFKSAQFWFDQTLARRPTQLGTLRQVYYIALLQGRDKDAEAIRRAHPEVVRVKRIAEFRAKSLYQRQEDIELVCDALRLAGVPE